MTGTFKSSFFFSFLIFIYLKDTIVQREGEMEKQIFNMLLHSPKQLQKPVYNREPGAQSLPRCITKELDGSQADTPVWQACHSTGRYSDYTGPLSHAFSGTFKFEMHDDTTKSS